MSSSMVGHHTSDLPGCMASPMLRPSRCSSCKGAAHLRMRPYERPIIPVYQVFMRRSGKSVLMRRTSG